MRRFLILKVLNSRADNWYNDVNHQAAIYASNEEYYFGIPEEKEIENEIQLALTKKGYNYQVDLD